MIIYTASTTDRFETTVYSADSIKELAKAMGRTENGVRSALCRHKKNPPMTGLRLREIVVEEDAVCLCCGKEYEKKTVTQKYCSVKCQQKYLHKNKAPRVSITFTCAYRHCGRTVVTETDRLDRRTRFCSRECEKKYWRHPPQDDPVCHIVKRLSGVKLDNERAERELRL